MNDRKTEKELRRAAEAEARDRDAKARRLAELEAAFWAAPFGQARSARIGGDRWFQIEIPLDWSVRSTSMTSSIGVSGGRRGGHGRTITDIENEGWELVHAGFVFKETGQVSRDKLLSSGQTVNTTGQTWGVYLFKVTDTATRTDEPWLAWAEAEGL